MAKRSTTSQHHTDGVSQGAVVDLPNPQAGSTLAANESFFIADPWRPAT